MTTTTAQPELMKALAAFQAQLPVVTKNADNPHLKSKYADLAAITLASRKLLIEAGLVVLQVIGRDADGAPVLTTTLYHTETGQTACTEIRLNVSKPTAQELGSWITYARRYSYATILGIIVEGEDDDGNAASQRGQQGNQRPRGNSAPPRNQPEPGLTDQPPAEPAPQPETLEQKAEKIVANAPNATAQQVEACQKWIAAHGYELPEELFDAALGAVSKRKRQLAATVS